MRCTIIARQGRQPLGQWCFAERPQRLEKLYLICCNEELLVQVMDVIQIGHLNEQYETLTELVVNSLGNTTSFLEHRKLKHGE